MTEFARKLRRSPSTLVGNSTDTEEVHFSGSYSSWDEAAEATDGYDSNAILEKAIIAARKVRDGQAVFERDTVCMSHPEWNWPILAALYANAARISRPLSVIDFGGALGSLYYQHRNLLIGSIDFRWKIVEQPHFAAAGKSEFEGPELSFHSSIDDAVEEASSSVLLLSSVLQYLPDPWVCLSGLMKQNWAAVVLDRTAIRRTGEADLLTIQTVPPSIYPASYPAWFLKFPRIKEVIGPHYVETAWWTNGDQYQIDVEEVDFVGLWMQRQEK